MKKFANFLAWIFIWAATGSPALADSSPVGSWKMGDMWDLQVDLADKTIFIMHAMVGGVETVQGSPCWQVTFLPGNGAPDFLKNKRRRVTIDQKTGWPLRALRVPEKQAIAVESAGLASFVTGLPDGIPLEFFNPDDLPTGRADIPGTTRRIEVRKEDKADHFFVEMALFDNDVEEWRVRQQWVPGEKWWHTYERTVKGQKTLTAKRMNAPPLKAEVAAKKDQDPAILAARFPLRMDPKLRAKVSAVGTQLQLADLLERLRTVTGLNITLAENLKFHAPAFGDVNMADAPAWALMGLIAEKEIENGKWEKTDDGYMLTGTSKALKIPPWRFPWEWTLGTVGILVLGFGAVLIYRRRRVKAKATASKV